MPGHPITSHPSSLPSLQGEFRRVDQAVEQLDRRTKGHVEPEFTVKHIGPMVPSHKRGRLWLRPRNPEAT
jgi:hypothetical protein